MNIEHNVSLAPYTSFGVGGPAEQFVKLASVDAVADLPQKLLKDCITLGYGANVLVSDDGLDRLTVVLTDDSTESIQIDGSVVTASAACNWDKLVDFTVKNGWWGLELTSGIPGGVGAAVVGNIAAYGQAVADTLVSVEVLDKTTGEQLNIPAKNLDLDYRSSNLQTTNSHLILLSASFRLDRKQTTELTYQSALNTAENLGLSTNDLTERRQIILETRRKAGSLLDDQTKTAGSFFRNPLVSPEQAEKIIKHDETGKTASQIKKMNLVHGGADMRVSAAHVLLAAGFSRGQTWGAVRLHPDHVLKIENTGGASAQDIYDVARHIQQVVKEKLDITIEPEVRFLGNFD